MMTMAAATRIMIIGAVTISMTTLNIQIIQNILIILITMHT